MSTHYCYEHDEFVCGCADCEAECLDADEPDVSRLRWFCIGFAAGVTLAALVFP